MDAKTRLENLAWEVNDILSEYIDIHNDLMKRSSTPLSVFRPIDFGSFEQKTKSLITKIIEKTDDIRNSGEVLDFTNPSQKEFQANLYSYCESLTETFQILLELISGLLERSKGSKGSKYGIAEHNKTFSRYKESRVNYGKFGARLNELYDKI